MPKIDYSKTKLIKELSVPERVTVIGCGGTGAWIALLAVLSGVTRISLFDDAVVSDTGLSRLPLTPSQLGCSKVEAVAAVLREYRPKIEIEVHKRLFRLDSDSQLLDGTIFICSDSAAFVKRFGEYAANAKLRYFFAPYCGLAAGVFTKVPDGLTLDGSGGAWVGGAALAASLAVTSAFGTPFDLVVDPKTAHLAHGAGGALGVLSGGSSL